jgi:hypothetical protein
MCRECARPDGQPHAQSFSRCWCKFQDSQREEPGALQELWNLTFSMTNFRDVEW